MLSREEIEVLKRDYKKEWDAIDHTPDGTEQDVPDYIPLTPDTTQAIYIQQKKGDHNDRR